MAPPTHQGPLAPPTLSTVRLGSLSSGPRSTKDDTCTDCAMAAGSAAGAVAAAAIAAAAAALSQCGLASESTVSSGRTSPCACLGPHKDWDVTPMRQRCTGTRDVLANLLLHVK